MGSSVGHVIRLVRDCLGGLGREVKVDVDGWLTCGWDEPDQSCALVAHVSQEAAGKVLHVHCWPGLVYDEDARPELLELFSALNRDVMLIGRWELDEDKHEFRYYLAQLLWDGFDAAAAKTILGMVEGAVCGYSHEISDVAVNGVTAGELLGRLSAGDE